MSAPTKGVMDGSMRTLLAFDRQPPYVGVLNGGSGCSRARQATEATR
ncbi:MAG: hypothetical protein OEM67_07075 [Thermoleophilia bacterium]|nr:hypothetical protein [Thermoleophilia bacterium]